MHISDEFKVKELTYRTKEDQYFSVLVVSKSDGEYQTHVQNFKSAGFDVVEGLELAAIKMEDIEEPPTYAQILKANPYHAKDGSFTTKDKAAGGNGYGMLGNASTSIKVKPAFTPRTKVTIQGAQEALAKQGLTMEYAGMTDLTPKFKISSKNGNSVLMTAGELKLLLTGKAKKEETLLGVTFPSDD